MNNNKLPSAKEILNHFGLDENIKVYKYAYKAGDTPGYIIAYENSDGILTFQEGNYINEDVEYKIYKCIGEMQVLIGMPLNVPYNVTKENKETFYRMLSSAFVQACYGNLISAYKLIDEAKKFYKAIATEKAREISLKTAIGIAMFALLLLLLLCTSCILEVIHKVIVIDFKWFEGALMGVIGSTISVWQRYGKVIYTGYYKHCLYSLEVIARCIVGLFFAIVFMKVFEEGWISSNLITDLSKGDYLLLGFIGGFSERLVPSIVEQFAKEKKDKTYDEDELYEKRSNNGTEAQSNNSKSQQSDDKLENISKIEDNCAQLDISKPKIPQEPKTLIDENDITIVE